MSIKITPLFTLPSSYPDSIDLLTSSGLSRLPISSAHLQSLVIPALGALLIQRLLFFPARHRSSLTPALP